MIVESKLAAFVQAALAEYKANPLLVEQIFFDASQTGFPSGMGNGFLHDAEKIWLPDEYAGGTLRWSGETFPILSNSADTLIITGDPSALENAEGLPYQVTPPAVAGLNELLQNEKFTVLTAFAQVPTQMPCVTLRLEKDEQSDTWIGENLEQFVVDGVEVDLRSQGMTGSYLLSVWAVNREAVLWLYAWLQNALLRAIPQFNTWGLYDISFSGSDLDPTLQYLAERVYTRHLLLTATRIERAVQTRGVEWVSGFCVKVLAQYQTFNLTVAQRGV